MEFKAVDKSKDKRLELIEIHIANLENDAMSELLRLAENGDDSALVTLGDYFLGGLNGLPQNGTLAAFLYEKAVASRNFGAMEKLGDIHFYGLNGAVNMRRALVHYTGAVDGHLPHSAFMLGKMYEEGIVVDVDLDRAKMWYTASKAYGNTEADVALERLAKLED